MSLDKYQQAWKSEASQVQVTFDADLLSKEVQKSHESFRTTIFWRDVREVGTSLVMIPIWFVMGNIIPVPWTWWLTVPVFLWIAGFMLVDRRRHPQSPSDPGEPLLFYVNESLSQVEHQIWLLRNVFWWYLLPPSISIMAFFLHVAWMSSTVWWEFVLVSAGSGLFLIVLYGLVYRINQRAVRDQLEPRRQHLKMLVANLEGESDAADSNDLMELASSLTDTVQNAGLSPSWATWSQNWNRIIPSWREVALILVPTLVGAFCGFRYSIPDMGPVFFQSVVAAVIPFEIALFGLWYLSYRRHKGQPLKATGKVRPNGPAIVTIAMILVISAFVVAALYSAVAGMKSQLASGSDDISAFVDDDDIDYGDQGLSDSELRRMLEDLRRKHNVPSLSIAVVSFDGMVATQCNGIRKRGSHDAVSISDRHPLGGCTQSMTATLAAVIVETGKIHWDTTIIDVWPNADDLNIHPSLRDVTLDELLSHQSGLAPNLSGDEWVSFFDEKASPTIERRRMLELVLDLKPEYPRGEHHRSNLGYVVAAAMLEERDGDSFENMMRLHVFAPLEMDTADFRTMARARKLTPPLLWGHRVDGTPVDPRIAGAENPSVYAPCGTAHASIADFARFGQWHLKYVAAPLLTEQETLDHLHAGQVDAPSLGGSDGCGWIFLNTQLGRAMTQGGTNTNSRALIWILPDRDFAAVACTNTGENSGFLACDEAIRELMKRYAGTPGVER